MRAQVADRDPAFLDREDIVALQRDKLDRLGLHLEQDPAWTAHFKRSGLRPRDLSDASALSSLPLLEKTDLRERYPYPFLTVPVETVRRFCATSGTTGAPVLFGFTEHDLNDLLPAQLCRIFRTVGIEPEDRVYQGYGYGLWIGGVAMDIGLAAYGAVNYGVGPGRGELVVEWLRDHGYTACTLSPLWMLTLTRLAEKAGLDPKRDWRLRVGLFGGQSISRQLRDELEAALPTGFMAHNIYGTTEAGGPVVAVSCPYSHGSDEMHLINEDTILTEVLDPETLAPVRPGEVGEIVITTLDKQASPVVRWRTRDLVRLSPRPYDCPCGRRGLPLIGRIIGRSDDMLKVRGVIVFPSQVEDVLAGAEHTVKDAWQIYVDTAEAELDEITVAIERRAGAPVAPRELEAEVRVALRARLGLMCQVECSEEGMLPRFEAKAVRVQMRGKRAPALS